MSTELAKDLTQQQPQEVTRPRPQVVTETSPRPGGFWIRSFAFLVDCVTCAMIVFPIYIIAAFAGAPFSPSGRAALEMLVLFSVVVIPTYAYGGSPGKLVFDLRVVDNRPGRHLKLGQILFRETVGRLISTLFLLCGYLNLLFNPDKETWHDLLSRTQVIQIQAENDQNQDW